MITFSVVSIAIFAIVSLCMESINMLSLWELILFVLMYQPVMLYGRRNKAWSGAYFSFASVVMILRFPYVTYIATSQEYIQAPISMNIILVRQSVGVVFLAGMLAYLMYLWFITSCIIRNELNRAEGYKQINVKEINRARNIIGGSVAMYAVCVLLSGAVYSLRSMFVNLIVYILAALLIQVAHSMYVRAAMRDWVAKKEESNKAFEAARAGMSRGNVTGLPPAFKKEKVPAAEGIPDVQVEDLSQDRTIEYCEDSSVAEEDEEVEEE